MVSDLGFQWLDYGARWYDPSVGRFTGVDPISDQFPHVSTYNYAENEPIANIDLWGLQAISAITNKLSVSTPRGRNTATLTQTNTVSTSQTKFSYSNKVTVTNQVTVDSKGEFISGACTVCESTVIRGTTTEHKVISQTGLSADENGNIDGIGADMNVAIETIKNDGIDGGLIGSVLSDEATAGAAGAAGMVTAAEQKGVKLGLLGKIFQAFGVGAAIGNVLSDLDNKTVELSSSSQSIDNSKAEQIMTPLKDNEDDK